MRRLAAQVPVVPLSCQVYVPETATVELTGELYYGLAQTGILFAPGHT